MELDCQDYQAALRSVAAAYAATPEDIESFLSALDLESHYDETDPILPGDQELARLLDLHLGRSPLPITKSFWFHLTRAPQGTDFRQGLIPLAKAIPGIWTTLASTIPNPIVRAKFDEFQRIGPRGRLYSLKVGESVHDGPYAMLVRDAAFNHQSMGNHDYLGMPEIIEDICNDFQEYSGESLHEAVATSLEPCIVKFWSASRVGVDCLHSALFYLYLKVTGQPMAMLGNTCYDASGEAIPPTRIVNIDWNPLPNE